MDLSWSAGDRVSGRYMARDRMSSDVGISWCRCSSSHCEREVKTQAHLWPGRYRTWPSPPRSGLHWGGERGAGWQQP